MLQNRQFQPIEIKPWRGTTSDLGFYVYKSWKLWLNSLTPNSPAQSTLYQSGQTDRRTDGQAQPYISPRFHGDNNETITKFMHLAKYWYPFSFLLCNLYLHNEQFNTIRDTGHPTTYGIVQHKFLERLDVFTECCWHEEGLVDLWQMTMKKTKTATRFVIIFNRLYTCITLIIIYLISHIIWLCFNHITSYLHDHIDYLTSPLTIII